MDDNSLSIIIADDETPAREEMLHLLKEVPQIRIRGIARDGLEALEMLKSLDADLALLDIEMPGMNGIEIAGTLLGEGSPTLFIFTTAYDAFAINAFEVHAVDYLLKPIRHEKLKAAIERARLILMDSRKNNRIPDTFFQSFPSKQERTSPFISIYKGDQIIPVKISSIIYAEARGRFVWVATDKSEYKTALNFSEACKILCAPHFFNCHRSYIIRLESIESIDLWVNSSYRLKMKGFKTSIPVSRNQKEEFQRLMRI